MAADVVRTFDAYYAESHRHRRHPKSRCRRHQRNTVPDGTPESNRHVRRRPLPTNKMSSGSSAQRLILVAAIVVAALNVPPHHAQPFTQIVHQHLAMEPQDQIAEIGARVTLPCRVVNKKGMLQWTRDDFGLGTHRRLTGFDRYAMIGSDEEGDYSLQIYPVEMEDDALFQCQVSASGEGE